MRDVVLDIGDLELDCGATLTAVRQRATIYGDPHASRPVVLVCHALTGSSEAAQWWPAMVGRDAHFDPRAWTIVCINALGSCYGSTGPALVTPFPRVTVADIVRAQARAIDALGMATIDTVIGGSLGGMQALQWALDRPDRVRRAIVVAAHDHCSALGIGLNAVQRECIALDPIHGLRTARKLAMLSYKSDTLLQSRHANRADRYGVARYDIEGYLERQADRLATRMDATTYATLTHAMDAFDVRDRSREDHAPLHFIGIASDWLFRASEVHAAARRFNATYSELASEHGHDAFLLSELLDVLGKEKSATHVA